MSTLKLLKEIRESGDKTPYATLLRSARKYQDGGFKDKYPSSDTTTMLPEVGIVGTRNSPEYQAYQDSLRLYNTVLNNARQTAIIEAKESQKNYEKHLKNVASGSSVRFWEKAKVEEERDEEDIKWYDNRIEQAKVERNLYSDPNKIKKEVADRFTSDMENFDIGAGYQLKYGKNKYREDDEYPDKGYIFTPIVSPEKRPNYSDYLQEFINYRQEEIDRAVREGSSSVSVGGMAATSMEGAKNEIKEAQEILNLYSNSIKPIGFTMGLEKLSTPIYKKPTNPPNLNRSNMTPIKPTSTTTSEIKTREFNKPVFKESPVDYNFSGMANASQWGDPNRNVGYYDIGEGRQEVSMNDLEMMGGESRDLLFNIIGGNEKAKYKESSKLLKNKQ